jgi:hypothetical protein
VQAFERAWQAGKIHPVLAEWEEAINRAA